MTRQATVPDWISDLFRAIDRKDTDAFTGFLADSVVFRFGSAPPVQGKSATAEAVTGFFESIAALSHTIDKVWADDASTVCEGTVTYTRHDGKDVPIPFTDVFDLAGEKIGGYRIYIDMSPLFET